MLRIRQKRLNDSRNRTRPIRRFRFTSVPNHNGMLASHRARNALKRWKEHLMKHVKMSGQLKQAQGKMQRMSTEVLNEKIETLKLPSAQLELGNVSLLPDVEAKRRGGTWSTGF